MSCKNCDGSCSPQILIHSGSMVEPLDSVQYFPSVQTNTINFGLHHLEVMKLHPDGILPTRTNSNDAGLDLYSLEDVFVMVGTTKTIRTGVAINIPAGYVGNVEDRSGLAAKGLKSADGVIDSGYNGEVSAILHNLTCTLDTDPILHRKGYKIKKGDRISQLVVHKVELPTVVEVTESWESSRGSSGFSSSGR